MALPATLRSTSLASATGSVKTGRATGTWLSNRNTSGLKAMVQPTCALELTSSTPTRIPGASRLDSTNRLSGIAAPLSAAIPIEQPQRPERISERSQGGEVEKLARKELWQEVWNTFIASAPQVLWAPMTTDHNRTMAAASDASASASSADKTAAASTAGALKDDGESPCLRMDVHTHILPRTWPDLKARYGYGGFIKLDHHHKCSARMLRDDGTFFREVGARTWDLDARIAESNRIAMNVQVLSTVPVMFSYWAKPDHALDLSKMLNDHMASCVAANPTRFVGLGTIPLQDPDLACDELKRCVNELGLRGERAKPAEITCTDSRKFSHRELAHGLKRRLISMQVWRSART